MCLIHQINQKIRKNLEILEFSVSFIANFAFIHLPKSEQIKTRCIFCRTLFSIPVCKRRGEKKGFGIYCSLQCRSQHRHLKSIEARICIQCGDIFFTKKKSKQKYCSRECSMITFHDRRHKMRNYRNISIQTPLQKKEMHRVQTNLYRQTEEGKAKHREDEALRKRYGTSNVLLFYKKRLAIHRVLKKCFLKKSNFNISLLIAISEGRTYEAYIDPIHNFEG